MTAARPRHPSPFRGEDIGELVRHMAAEVLRDAETARGAAERLREEARQARSRGEHAKATRITEAARAEMHPYAGVDVEHLRTSTAQHRQATEKP